MTVYMLAGNYAYSPDEALSIDRTMRASSLSITAAGGAVTVTGISLSISTGSQSVTINGIDIIDGHVSVNDANKENEHQLVGCTFRASTSRRRRLAGTPSTSSSLSVTTGTVRVAQSTFDSLATDTNGAAITVSGSSAYVIVVDSNFTSNKADEKGGAIYVTDNARLLTINANFSENEAGVSGNALHVNYGIAVLSDRTTMTQKLTVDGSLYSKGDDPKSAFVVYVLPTPDAHHVASLAVNCSSLDCSSLDEGIFEYAKLDEGIFKNQLHGHSVAKLLPNSHESSGTAYPITCSAGTYGRRGMIADQLNPDCYERCPEGYYCEEATVEPAKCLCGHYCPEGAFASIACPGGTYSNRTDLISKGMCQKVPPGFTAPAGSCEKIACPTGYKCPGTRNDDVNPTPGSQPILLQQGTTNLTTSYSADLASHAMTLMVDTAAVDVTSNSTTQAFQDTLATTFSLEEAYVQLVPGDSGAAGTRRQLLESSTNAIPYTFYVYRPEGSTDDEWAAVKKTLQGADPTSDTAGTVTAAIGAYANITATFLDGTTRTLMVRREVEIFCPEGYWCSAGLLIPCTEGTYNPNNGSYASTSCTRCPDGATTLFPASKSIDQCVCDSLYYNKKRFDGVATTNDTCTFCTQGTTCHGLKNVTIPTLPIRPGYYRAFSNSMDVRQCPDLSVDANCSLDDLSVGCPYTTSACRGTVNANLTDSSASGRRLSSRACDDDAARCEMDYLQCAPGLQGPLCQICDQWIDPPDDDGMTVYYYSKATNDEVASCKACEPGTTAGYIATVFGGIALLFLVMVIAMFVSRKFKRHKFYRKFKRWAQIIKPMMKLKQLYGFFIITSLIDKVYAIVLPTAVSAFLNAMSVIVMPINYKVFMGTFQCVGLSSYKSTLTFWILMPFLVVAIGCGAVAFQLHHRGLLKRSKWYYFYACLPLTLFVLFIAYPTVTNVAFEAFVCTEFESVTTNDAGAVGNQIETVEYMTADVRIKCGTSEYDDIKVLAWTAVLLYPVGIMVFCSVLLYANRKTIADRKSTTFSRAIGFLHKDFNPNFFWWEIAEMFRRFMLVGLMGLYRQGQVIQVMLATLFCVVYLVIQVHASPYLEQSHSFVGVVVSASLVIFFLLMMIYKYSSLLELNDISVHLSPQQNKIYKPDTLFLTFLMVLAVVIVLVAAFGISAYNGYMELRRIRREDLASKARRLRFVKTQLSVPAPRRPEGKLYHIFLSHVWGTGQDQMRVIKQRLLEMIQDLKVFLDVDDLEDISDLEGYIDKTIHMLIHCSQGYFQSKNCMRELISTVKKKKKVVATLELDMARGGLTMPTIKQQLLECEEKNFAKWDFGEGTPTATELYDYLFQDETAILEWARIGSFQDVTMRLIVEKILEGTNLLRMDSESMGSISGGLLGNLSPMKQIPVQLVRSNTSTRFQSAFFIQGELSQMTVHLPEPNYVNNHDFHVYCSTQNAGAQEIIDEVAHKKHLAVTTTANFVELEQCEFFLLYLNSKTWTSGDASANLAEELRRAFAINKPVLLVHEMTGLGGQEEKFGCEFSDFFQCEAGTTPPDLIRMGIYATIAVALKGAAWREASMVLLAQALANYEHPPPASKFRFPHLGRSGSSFPKLSTGISKLSVSFPRGSSGANTPRSGVNTPRSGVSTPRTPRDGPPDPRAVSTSDVENPDLTLAGRARSRLSIRKKKKVNKDGKLLSDSTRDEPATPAAVASAEQV